MKTIILVFAMPEEFEAFATQLSAPITKQSTYSMSEYNDIQLVMMMTGVTVFNTYKLASVLNQFEPLEVIQVGTCAGLKKQNIGDVIHAKTFYHADLDLSAFGRIKGRLNRGPKPKSIGAVLVSGSAFLASEANRIQLTHIYDGDGFDMESFGFFTICEQANIPFSSIRGISDNGNNDAKDNFTDNLKLAANHAAAATLRYLKQL
jgi:nucleoside phosphorylase